MCETLPVMFSSTMGETGPDAIAYARKEIKAPQGPPGCKNSQGLLAMPEKSQNNRESDRDMKNSGHHPEHRDLTLSIRPLMPQKVRTRVFSRACFSLKEEASRRPK